MPNTNAVKKSPALSTCLTRIDATIKQLQSFIITITPLQLQEFDSADLSVRLDYLEQINVKFEKTLCALMEIDGGEIEDDGCKEFIPLYLEMKTNLVRQLSSIRSQNLPPHTTHRRNPTVAAVSEYTQSHHQHERYKQQQQKMEAVATSPPFSTTPGTISSSQQDPVNAAIIGKNSLQSSIASISQHSPQSCESQQNSTHSRNFIAEKLLAQQNLKQQIAQQQQKQVAQQQQQVAQQQQQQVAQHQVAQTQQHFAQQKQI